MRPTPDWPIRDLLTHRVATTPDATAVIDAADGGSWTYADLDERVERTASNLADGLVDGDVDLSGNHRPRVVIHAGTDLHFVVSLFAAWRLGAQVVPLDPALPSGDVERRLARLDPDLVIPRADGGPIPRVYEEVVYSPDSANGYPDSPTSQDAPPSRGPSDDGYTALPWSPTDPALVLFTSGTTDEPKGVQITHRNLVASATGSALRLGLDTEERWLDCLPTNHMGGLAPIVRSTFYGTTVVLQREYDRRATASAMDQHDVTAVSLVPTQLRRLVDDGWEPPASLRFVLLGGAPADSELVSSCAERGIPVCPTYGTTETASQIATAAPGEASSHPETVGSPLMVADVTIVDPDDGTPVETGSTGELVVDGPIVTPGYLDDSATDEAFGERGLHTGDLASRDAAGRLFVHGRLDDAIQTGGETVHPWRVRRVIEAIPGVESASVVGLADPEWGERVSVLLVSDGAEVDEEGVLERCREELASYEVPKTVSIVESLPRTESGTIDRGAVRDRLRS